MNTDFIAFPLSAAALATSQTHHASNAKAFIANLGATENESNLGNWRKW
jgi:hypothetical protein